MKSGSYVGSLEVQAIKNMPSRVAAEAHYTVMGSIHQE
jgi:hypothetical protein